ncbi:hypothetical protein K474DRAFT_1661927 [Panus rudis PR-1116 ss-1]|nr:hypothetical protein K474DRAFT_1661927 [Panus rudis PR-1116 ss-1]
MDKNGAATRHHRTALTNNITSGREGYETRSLPEGPKSKTDSNQILAYFKIPDYTPIDIDDFTKICAETVDSASRMSFSPQENRQAGITCRTWVIQILSRILSPGRATIIEDFVTKQSAQYDSDRLYHFIWSPGNHVAKVTTVPL